MTAHLETILRDVAAELATAADLTTDQRRALAIQFVKSRTRTPMHVCAVTCAVFSRSALFHLGGAMIPANDGEAQQFHEQARGGFVQLGTIARPHLVLRAGPYVLDPVHSAAWNDRGVWIRPFVSRFTSPGWIADGLPFGVQVAYEFARSHVDRRAA